MGLRSRLILAIPVLLASFAGPGGCAAPASTPVRPGVGHRSLVLPSPLLVGLGAVADPTAAEHGRNDGRLGRVGPRPGIILDRAVVEDRQRIHVSGDRVRDHSTYRIRTWQLRSN